jgi:hypothetical protein
VKSTIEFLALHPKASFSLRQSRVRLFVEFDRRDSLCLALGYACPSDYAEALVADALEKLKNGFSEEAADSLSVAVLYSSWLASGQEFQSIYGVMLWVDSLGDGHVGGFSDDRWNAVLQDMEGIGLL